MRRCLTIATILMTWSAAATAQQLAPAKAPSHQKGERKTPTEAVLEVSRAKGLFDAVLAKGGPTCVINSIAMPRRCCKSFNSRSTCA